MPQVFDARAPRRLPQQQVQQQQQRQPIRLV
jgi:hypothetical protein